MYIMYNYDMWTVMFSFRYTFETKQMYTSPFQKWAPKLQ